jgi:hypothetical protein
MDINADIRRHDKIQEKIMSACRDIGVEAIQEYRGRGWRADVFVPRGDRPIAFEIQLTAQSLRKTIERQSKYITDGIIGCWLFDNPIPKLIEERPDLPVFYVEEKESDLIVNLGNRRKIDLTSFLKNFIFDKIQFRPAARAKKRQQVNLAFFAMKCWKCGETNHLFYVESPFYSSCNAVIRPEEALWESLSIEYRPEIIDLAERFVQSKTDLRLGQIKMRYSNTVQHAYMSFGCYKCDSLFGDFYVMDAKMEAVYDDEKITHTGEIELTHDIELADIPHWCFPDDGHFC